MCSPVSGASAAYLSQTSSAQSNQAPKTSSAPASQPEDSVHLSAAAQAAASGDVDHDGDSH